VDYEGIVIEESLEDTSALLLVEVIDTRVEPITPEHQTPWISQLTLHTIRISEASARSTAEAISKALDAAHPASWYADFKSDTHHYVIYRNRIFHIDRRSREQYAEAVEYGIANGLPEHQADFVALIEG
jgi:hypothetical protein